MNLTIPPSFRPYAFAILALVVVAAITLVVVVILKGGNLDDPHVSQLLGYAAVIITVLIAALGLSGQVTAVHNAINGRLTQLVDATAAKSFLEGQAAPAGAPIPPAPSTQLTPPIVPPVKPV
jgi:hypothetical protein